MTGAAGFVTGKQDRNGRDRKTSLRPLPERAPKLNGQGFLDGCLSLGKRLPDGLNVRLGQDKVFTVPTRQRGNQAAIRRTQSPALSVDRGPMESNLLHGVDMGRILTKPN